MLPQAYSNLKQKRNTVQVRFIDIGYKTVSLSNQDDKMKRKIFTAAMIAPVLATPGQAANHQCYVPMKDWHSRAEAVRFAVAQGWTVRRVRIDDGCYEIIGVNAEGVDIEARLNPGDFTIIQLELEPFGQRETGAKND